MKQVLVTGGRSNLGMAICKEFESAGYEVFYTVTTKDKAVGEHAIVVNLTDPEDIKAKLTKLTSLDVLVNNAGVFTSGKQESLPLEDFDKVFNLNMRGLFLTIQTLLPLLKKSDGSIVNISSLNALHPGFGTTAHYDASKGAVSAYTASLAFETGLRVNAVAPGLIEVERLVGSDLDKLYQTHSVKGEMLTPLTIAKAVFFLAESQGIYGQTLLVDNGYTLK